VTQGVLWRLNSGQWSPGRKPKLVVLLIGTNNANWGSRPENTALGVAEIIRFINTHSPTTKILLIGILPRGEDATTPERAVNRQVNDLIMRCADGDKIVYMDPGQAMMDSNGRISNQVLFDYLHPTEVGYAILGGSIIAQVRKMMQK
jgi:beta-glucosidase